MGASIAEVAALAEVSRTTVSHTISGKRTVSSAVRERVLAAMSELGYVPSRSARSLALGRTQIIGLLIPDVTNGYFAELTKGVEATAAVAGYNVILANTGFDRARELHDLEMIRSRAVDGIIYAAGAAIGREELGRVLDGMPLVLVDEELHDSSAFTVVSDNYDGGRQAAKHLLDLGHRQALAIGAPDSLLSSALRLEGFSDAWTNATGTAPVAALDSFTFEGGTAGVAQHLDVILGGKITAIFGANDLIALGAIRHLKENGMRVPHDASVVGFDDSPLARYTDPALTTVRQDVWALGARGATALISALENQQSLEPEREVREVELVIRGTTGPPGNGPIQ